MSLRHALLAILTAEPMTGYDLVKYFDGSVGFVWQAPHSQIYPELRRMESDGLVDAQVVARGERAEKRVYTIRDEGRAELRAWVVSSLPYPPERNPHRLQAAFMEWSTYTAARNQLLEHRNYYARQAAMWQDLIEDIQALRVPLLQRRLETRPEVEHEAIVAFKVLAFQGELARTRAELEWANDGLELLDDLEARGLPLATDDSPAASAPLIAPAASTS